MAGEVDTGLAGAGDPAEAFFAGHAFPVEVYRRVRAISTAANQCG